MDRESTGASVIVTDRVTDIAVWPWLPNLFARTYCTRCDRWFEPFEAHEHKEIAA